MEMNDAAQNALGNCDLFIGTAAVADYRPSNNSNQKIKKDQQGNALTLQLTENPDIIAGVAKSPNRPKVVIAFAAETQDIENYARQKISKKGVDAVVANDVSRDDIGFGSDQNEIIWVTETEGTAFGPTSKRNIAKHIIEKTVALLK
jgi:phosphopantothenoylcysteine decarboxylase/phosphopantothenate--cysteine ligase